LREPRLAQAVFQNGGANWIFVDNDNIEIERLQQKRGDLVHSR
jgi:hypothetical protein